MALLSVKNLNITYKNKEKEVYAVDDISFDMESGDSLGIVGESGSGKSTLAMGILRLLSPKTAHISGNAFFKEKDLLTMSMDEFNKLRWKQISVVFQKSMNTLSPIHKIGDQLEDIYKVHESKATKDQIKGRVLELFKLVNLSDRVYNLYPHELSGGMLQRTSIALSLLHNPELIVLDEATTALDVVTQGQILSEIKKLEKTINMTRIMITHDMSVVATVCDKVAVMYAGRLVEFGLVKDVITNPQHPYTQGLIKSYPLMKAPKDELTSIPGSLPNLSKKYEGCIFAPRCDRARDICRTSRPKNTHIKPGHMVSCHSAEGDSVK